MSSSLVGQSSIDLGEQVLSYLNFSVKDGLSHHRVNGVFQDSRNLYWISTRYGLNRFDGETFKVYTKEKHGLKTNIIDAAFEDNDGMIWIFTDDNGRVKIFIEGKKMSVSLFNPYTEQLIDLEEYLTPQLANDLKNIAFYSRKTLDGSLVFITKSGEIIKYHHRSKVEYQQLPFSFTECFYYQELSNGNFWVRIYEGYEDQFLLLSREGKVLKKHTFKALPEEKAKENDEEGIKLRPVYAGEQGDDIWFQTYNHTLIQFSPTGEATYTALLDILPNLTFYHNIIYYHPAKQQVWVKVKHDLYIAHLSTGTFDVLKGFELSYIHLKDNQNFIWTSGPSNSLFALEIHQQRFQQYAENHVFRGIVKDENNTIWACPNYIQNRSLEDNSQYFNSKNKLNSISIIKDEQGNIWTANPIGDKSCLILFEKGKHTINEQFCHDNIEKEIWSLTKEKNTNGIWLGGRGQLSYFDIDNQKFSFFKKYNDYPKFNEGIIYQIIEYQSGKLWVVSSNGLFLVDKNEGVLASYRSTQKGDFYLPANDFHHLHIDQDSIFWLGTGDGGLIKWLPPFISKYRKLPKEQPRYQQLTQSDGLPSNVIHAVYESSEQYQDGFLWLNTENGIAQFHKATHFSHNYNTEDGLVHNEGNRNSHYQDENGQIYFGTVSGITIFHPKDFQEPPSTNGKNIHIVGLEQFNSSTGLLENKMWELEQTNTITLHSGARRVDIKVNLPFSIRGQRQFFTYQIKGYQDQPIHLNQSSFIISDLPFGKYELSLKLSNSMGEVLDEQVVRLISKPPFYLQWWFILLSITFLSTSIFLGIKWRLASLEKQKQRLEAEVHRQTEELRQLNAMKDRFFGIIAHDLRDPLISLKGTAQNMDFLLRKKRLEQAKKVGEYISNSTKEISGLLDNLLNWAMSQMQKNIVYHPKPLELEPIIVETVQLLKYMATAKQINLQTNIAPNSQAFADKNSVATIIRNLVNNALKFTPNNGTVTISTHIANEKIIVKISDTGIGIPKEKQATIFELDDKKSTRGTAGEKGIGLGLMLCKEFVEQNKGEIWVESSCEHQGTSIAFSLPLFKHHPK